MPTYHHLTKEERDLIAVMKSEGRNLRTIAQAIGRDPGTISRELKRNVPPIHTGYYLPHKAQARADLRNQATHRRPRLRSRRLRAYAARQLRRGWSPELIAGRLRRLGWKELVSPEAIYQWIYADARDLIPCLPRHHRRRFPKGHTHRHKTSHIPNKVPLCERPQVIGGRHQAGHWESDTAVSRQSPAVILASVERMVRYTKLRKLTRKGAHEVSVALTRTMSQYPRKIVRSFTYDNGSENTEHERTNQVLGTRSYFCEPYHSWEKGTVENTIGLVRRFLPKKTDFATISGKELRTIERWLNHRPRKCLNFATPAERFKELTVALTH